MVSSGRRAGGTPAEVPILLFKVRAETSEVSPADLSPFSVFVNEEEAVFPPGVYLEQHKETTEVLVGAADGGGELTVKVVEVVPHLPREIADRRQSVMPKKA